MITITTLSGVLHVPVSACNSAELIMGQCDHSVSLFNQCFDCIWLDSQLRFNKAFNLAYFEENQRNQREEEVTR